jgi:hypothetical protein
LQETKLEKERIDYELKSLQEKTNYELQLQRERFELELQKTRSGTDSTLFHLQERLKNAEQAEDHWRDKYEKLQIELKEINYNRKREHEDVELH